jgi:chromosome partitioning protein
MAIGDNQDSPLMQRARDRSALSRTWSNDIASSDDFLHGEPVRREPHIVVFANEKGGVGKSTSAFHTVVALCNRVESVAIIDLDVRQRSLGKAIENRQATGRRLDIELPCPLHDVVGDMAIDRLANEIRRLSRSHDFIVIDVAGHDSEIARYAISMADTLITPINDSFVDLALLGHIDPVEMRFEVLGPFARLVKHLATTRINGKVRDLDWVVIPNRIRRLGSNNEKRFSSFLAQIAPVAGFRMGHGLDERVIYRELYPFGLTLLDADFLPDLKRVRQVAQVEMQSMLASLKLPNRAHA